MYRFLALYWAVALSWARVPRNRKRTRFHSSAPISHTTPLPHDFSSDHDSCLVSTVSVLGDEGEDRGGKIACIELPLPDNSSLLTLYRGSEAPQLVHDLLSNLTLLDQYMDIDVYEYLFDSWKLARLRSVVEAIGAISRNISSILRVRDPADQVGKLPLTAQRVIRESIRGSGVYRRMRRKVEAIKMSLVNSINVGELSVGVPFMQALAVVEKLVLYQLHLDGKDFGGWEHDIARFGVEDPLDSTSRFSSLSEGDIETLRDHTLAVMFRNHNSGLYSDDVKIVTQLGVHLSSANPNEDLAKDVSAHLCPMLEHVTAHISNLPWSAYRLRTRVSLWLLSACNASLDFKLGHSALVLWSYRPEFNAPRIIWSAFQSDPVEFTVCGRNLTQLVLDSKEKLESPLRAYPYARGVDVRFFGSEGHGPGLRHEWLAALASHYFRPAIDPTDPTALWESTDESQTSIRPRQLGGLGSSGIDNASLRFGLLASGRLLGIAIRYRTVLGVSLSPAVFQLLRGPNDPLDVSAMAKEEDIAFWNGLQWLERIDWHDGEQVSLAVGSGTTVEVDGVNIPVSNNSVSAFIKRQQFTKVVSSIREEMEIVKDGIYEVIRPGYLSMLTVPELIRSVTGLSELTAANIIDGIIFKSTNAAPLNEWLRRIIMEFSHDELVKFHKFVTGSIRPPIPAPGNGSTWMTFTVVETRSDKSLPTASTCSGGLWVPKYASIDIFRSKLLMAMSLGISIENH